MVARSTSSSFYPAPPKVRIPTFGNVYVGLGRISTGSAGQKSAKNLATKGTNEGNLALGLHARL